MRKTVRRQHGDPVKYVTYVLWLMGYSEGTIAKTLSLRRKQVAGIITRSEYAGRSAMTDHDRSEKLKELQEVRYEDGVPLDGGMLDRIGFEIMPAAKTALPGPLRRRM